MHAGSRLQSFVNPDPDVPPEINVSVDPLPCEATGLAGVTRQMVFDYAGTGTERRLVQLQFRPTTTLPAARASDWIELWVRGGELLVNGERAYANCFVVIEPGATFTLRAPFGANALGLGRGPRGVARRQRGQPVRVLVRARRCRVGGDAAHRSGGRAYRPGARGPAR